MIGDARPWTRSTAVMALVCFAWLAALAWARPLLLPDEGRYVGVAWEMVRSGEWLTPTLNGLPYFHKPPLFYWITAASLSTFGLHEFSARLAPLLGACAAAISTFLLVRRWCDSELAMRSAVVLLVQPLFYVGAQFANLDMLVAGCISTTIALLAHVALCHLYEHTLHRKALLAAYASAAAGVLAKGLIGAVLPALVVFVWLAWQRRWASMRALVWLPGLAALVLLAAPWFLVMDARHPGFMHYFFMEQHVKRFAAGGFNNAQPWWFFPAVLAAFTLPFLPWLKGRPARLVQGFGVRTALLRLMVVWLLAVTVFFSIPQSKLVGYVLPVVPPLSVLLAASHQSSTGIHRRFWWPASTLLAAALGLVAVVYMGWHPDRSHREIAQILQRMRAPEEPVFVADGFPFDLPFYARLNAPMNVVEDWHSRDSALRDNWRKELADAAGFASTWPRDHLVDREELPAALCASRVSWIVAPDSASAKNPWLGHARRVATVRGTSLWRFEPDLSDAQHRHFCAGTSMPEEEHAHLRLR